MRCYSEPKFIDDSGVKPKHNFCRRRNVPRMNHEIAHAKADESLEVDVAERMVQRHTAVPVREGFGWTTASEYARRSAPIARFPVTGPERRCSPG
jgi:hypothetical protein